MTSWKILFRKEIHGSKLWIQMNVLLLGSLVLYSLINKDTDVRLLILLGIILLHIVYLPGWALYSIFKELKENTFTHWLNLPHNGFVLLSAKLVSGFVLMAVSLVISLLVAILPGIFSVNSTDGLTHTLFAWFLGKYWVIFIITVVSSMFAGAQIVFAVMIAKSLYSFRVLAAFGCLVLLSLLQQVFRSSPLLLELTQWGPLSLFPTTAVWWNQLAVHHYDLYASLYAVSNIMNLMYTGILIIELGASFLFVWLSSKLLDKYVHV